jgi:hypothetical protein
MDGEWYKNWCSTRFPALDDFFSRRMGQGRPPFTRATVQTWRALSRSSRRPARIRNFQQCGSWRQKRRQAFFRSTPVIDFSGTVYRICPAHYGPQCSFDARLFPPRSALQHPRYFGVLYTSLSKAAARRACRGVNCGKRPPHCSILSLVVGGAAESVSAMHTEERYQISFWDAESGGAGVLYTEDLNDGQQYGTGVGAQPVPGGLRHFWPKPACRAGRLHWGASVAAPSASMK